MKSTGTINVLYAQFGQLENGTKWSNLFVLADEILYEPQVVGRKPAKLPIDASDGDSELLARRILEKLKQAKDFPTPLTVELTTTVKNNMLVQKVCGLVEDGKKA